MVRPVAVPVRPGAPNPGDGVLQVIDGDVLTAWCGDCPGAPESQADVLRWLNVVVNQHQLSSESCHDDDSEPDISDFRNDLPSLLDAGELATLVARWATPRPSASRT